jgi:hypothetical protein
VVLCQISAEFLVSVVMSGYDMDSSSFEGMKRAHPAASRFCLFATLKLTFAGLAILITGFYR